MKKRDIYLAAVEQLDLHVYSCVAILAAAVEANRVPDGPLIEAYNELFKPADFCRHAWGVEWAIDGPDIQNAAAVAHDTDEGYNRARDCRVLALCFMAAIVGDEEVVS